MPIISDTRRICAGSGPFTEFVCIPSQFGPMTVQDDSQTSGVFKEFPLPYQIAAYSNYLWKAVPFQAPMPSTGYCVDVEIPQGGYLDIYLINTAYSSVSKIRLRDSGRHTGTLPTSNDNIIRYGANGSPGVIVKEYFIFDSSKYTLEQFLEDPVAQISTEKSSPLLTAAAVMPRLGFSPSVPVDVAAPWYSVLQTVTPTPQGYVIAATNSINTGQSDCKPVIATANGVVKVRVGIKAINDKHAAVGISGHNGTGYTQTGLSNFACVVVSGPGEVVGGSGGLFVLNYLSDKEETVVELSATIAVATASGFAFRSKQAQDTAGTAFTGESNLITFFQLINVDGAILLDAGSTPFYETGDRMENSAWDGLFSTPIAWVCIAPGCPGTWKAVNLFDAFNASLDPYFYSGNLSFNPWGPAFDSNTVMQQGMLVFPSQSARSGVQQPITSLGIGTINELLHWEVYVSKNSGTFVTLIAGNNVGAVVLGMNSGDIVNIDNSEINFSVQNALQGAIVTYLLVRPKYPFLTKAPATFTAAPATLTNASLSGSPDTWYQNTGNVTYSGGIITMPTSGAMWMWAGKKFSLGQKVRIRINVTTAGGSLLFGVMEANGNIPGSYATVDCTTTGMKEATWTISASQLNVMKIFIQATGGSVIFDYIRIYAE